MTHEYVRGSRYEAAVDPARCKASVSSAGSFRFHQCRRKHTADGWCSQHHPDAEAKRRKEQSARWAEERRARSVHERNMARVSVDSELREMGCCELADRVQEALK